MSKTARIFMNGRSQAVRLPAEFRFEADEVFVRRDTITGDVILSARPPRNYADFMAARDALGPFPAEFLSPAERSQSSELRDPFAPVSGSGRDEPEH